mgnify:CR=1 FL=1
MNKRYIFLCLAGLTASLLFAQFKYYNADQFPLFGKVTDQTETRYERLPAYLKDTIRPPVWHLGKDCAGLAIRFRTNSTSISAKWEVLKDLYMNHMTPTGIKGLDLYTWENEDWQFVVSGRPSGKVTEQVLVENMEPKEREYMLFLPLYDGITSLSIGIDSAKTIQQPALQYPDTTKPILVYGTSITQGGCATRPGMAYTNLLMRWMNREFINLGFSGNGKLDYEIAELIAKKNNASFIVLDFVANASSEQIQEKTIPFVDIIRKSIPDAPILLIETTIFQNALYDKKKYAELIDRNTNLMIQYEKLQNKYKNIFYLSADDLLGNDGEATVDGTHFTDLGFLRFSEHLFEDIRE